jgi:translocator protein
MTFPLPTPAHSLRLATLDSALLAATMGTLVVVAWKIRRLAALLLVPYALWTVFATALSWRLWRMNRR